LVPGRDSKGYGLVSGEARVAVVTGAAQGIGRRTAEALAAEGTTWR